MLIHGIVLAPYVRISWLWTVVAKGISPEFIHLDGDRASESGPDS